MNEHTAPGTFFLPGPTEIHPDVAAAMLRPMMSHRGAVFRATFERLQTGLRSFFMTEGVAIIAAGSATALMEMSVRSAPAGRILSLVNGGFSERFAKVARACGREVDQLDVPWGQAHDLFEVGGVLAKTSYAAVTVVHSETSTGVLTDVENLTRIAHEHGAVALVDSVSGAGGAPLETDAWALDFVFTGSQKTLALPPGLALGVANEKMIASARMNEGRGAYLDLVEYVTSAAKSETPSTPALSLLYALDAQLTLIAIEGMPARFERHAAMAQAVYSWVDASAAELGVGILAPAGNRSPTVTVITLPDTMPVADLLHAMNTRGYTIGAGYGPLDKNSVRIGHMGEHTVAGVQGCLAALDDALRALAARPVEPKKKRKRAVPA